MKKTELSRYLLGYLLGGSLFLILFPILIYGVAGLTNQIEWLGTFQDSIALKVITACLFVIGVIFAAWSNLFLVLRGRGGPTEGFGVAVSPKTKNLVQDGPYRYTRNPMVFGTCCIYISIALFLRSTGAVIFLLILMGFFTNYLKRSEEKRLVKDFGRAYYAYQKRVSFLIPLPPKS